MKPRPIIAIATIALVTATAIGAAHAGGGMPATDRGAEATSYRTTLARVATGTSAAAPDRARAAAAGLPDFTALVSNNGAAVVNIRVASQVTAVPAGAPPRMPSPFEWFFGGMPGQGRPDRPQQGIGSGFIVEADGTILTNAHVVEGADEVLVRMRDRREFPATVVGMDPETDVAVLKIEASGLPVVRIGDPQRLEVGQWVAAIGSPYGLEHTVTAGIVSATSRSLPSEAYVPFIQTDVAVNPGNSGGPLFNLDGEVVGINSQIYSRTGGWQGLSFAIPIDVAMKIKTQLVANGKVTRGRLGVAIQEVDGSLADSFGLDRPMGALVTSVDEGSGAAVAGLRPGDIILAVDSTKVLRAVDLARAIADRAPGDEVGLEVWRDGDRQVLLARVGARDTDVQVASAADAATPPRLGVRVRPLTASERSESGLDSGVLVSDVDGPAARAGIQAGDVILAINGTPVKDPQQLQGLLAAPQEQVALLVQRGATRIFVPVRLA